MEEMTPFDVVGQLDCLIVHMNIVPEFRILKLPGFRFLKRRSFSIKYKTLMIVLWNLALDQFYPNDSTMIVYLAQMYPACKHMKKFFRNRWTLKQFKELIVMKNGNPVFWRVAQVLVGDFMVARLDNPLEHEQSQLSIRISQYYDHFVKCYRDSYVNNVQNEFNYWVPYANKLRLYD